MAPSPTPQGKEKSKSSVVKALKNVFSKLGNKKEVKAPKAAVGAPAPEQAVVHDAAHPGLEVPQPARPQPNVVTSQRAFDTSGAQVPVPNSAQATPAFSAAVQHDKLLAALESQDPTVSGSQATYHVHDLAGALFAQRTNTHSGAAQTGNIPAGFGVQSGLNSVDLRGHVAGDEPVASGNLSRTFASMQLHGPSAGRPVLPQYATTTGGVHSAAVNTVTVDAQGNSTTQNLQEVLMVEYENLDSSQHQELASSRVVGAADGGTDSGRGRGRVVSGWLQHPAPVTTQQAAAALAQQQAGHSSASAAPEPHRASGLQDIKEESDRGLERVGHAEGASTGVQALGPAPPSMAAAQSQGVERAKEAVRAGLGDPKASSRSEPFPLGVTPTQAAGAPLQGMSVGTPSQQGAAGSLVSSPAMLTAPAGTTQSLQGSQAELSKPPTPAVGAQAPCQPSGSLTGASGAPGAGGSAGPAAAAAAAAAMFSRGEPPAATASRFAPVMPSPGKDSAPPAGTAAVSVPTPPAAAEAAAFAIAPAAAPGAAPGAAPAAAPVAAPGAPAVNSSGLGAAPAATAAAGAAPPAAAAPAAASATPSYSVFGTLNQPAPLGRPMKLTTACLGAHTTLCDTAGEQSFQRALQRKMQMVFKWMQASDMTAAPDPRLEVPPPPGGHPSCDPPIAGVGGAPEGQDAAGAAAGAAPGWERGAAAAPTDVRKPVAALAAVGHEGSVDRPADAQRAAGGQQGAVPAGSTPAAGTGAGGGPGTSAGNRAVGAGGTAGLGSAGASPPAAVQSSGLREGQLAAAVPQTADPNANVRQWLDQHLPLQPGLQLGLQQQQQQQRAKPHVQASPLDPQQQPGGRQVPMVGDAGGPSAGGAAGPSGEQGSGYGTADSPGVRAAVAAAPVPAAEGAAPADPSAASHGAPGTPEALAPGAPTGQAGLAPAGASYSYGEYGAHARRNPQAQGALRGLDSGGAEAGKAVPRVFGAAQDGQPLQHSLSDLYASGQPSAGTNLPPRVLANGDEAFAAHRAPVPRGGLPMADIANDTGARGAAAMGGGGDAAGPSVGNGAGLLASRDHAMAARPTSSLPPARTKTIAVASHCPPELHPQPSTASWTIDYFTLLRKLYEGSLSVVCQAQHRRSGRHVALKIYKRSRLHEMERFQLAREICLHIRIVHPYVVALYAAWKDSKYVYLALEWAPQGNMFDFLVSRGGRLSEQEAARVVMKPLMSALAFLHSQHFIHRDVKLENLLLDASCNLKLADFGLAIDQKFEQANTRLGTFGYFAPEVLDCPLKKGPFDLKDASVPGYDCRVDVWSAGVVGCEVLTGRAPFSASSPAKIIQAIRTRVLEFPGLSSDGADFLHAALTRDPNQRPTAKQLLSHPWILRHCGGSGAMAVAAASAGPSRALSTSPPVAGMLAPPAVSPVGLAAPQQVLQQAPAQAQVPVAWGEQGTGPGGVAAGVATAQQVAGELGGSGEPGVGGFVRVVRGGQDGGAGPQEDEAWQEGGGATSAAVAAAPADASAGAGRGG